KIVQQDISRIRLINAKRGQRGSTVVGDRDSECGEQQLPLLGIDADRLKPEAEVMKVDVRESSAGGENLGGGENQSSPQPPMPAGVKADIPEICRKIDAMYEKVLPAIKLYEGGRLLTAQQDRGRPGRHLEEELDRQILRTTREMMGYVKDLAEEVLVMVEYTRTVVLEKYTVEAATRLVEYFGALIRSMSLKLQILLLTMRVRLYTPELTSSLANLRLRSDAVLLQAYPPNIDRLCGDGLGLIFRASLELEERDLNAQLSRVREQLTMYRDAGDEFVQLAGVYRDVMQEIDRVRRDIDSISELRD
ncbi:hypothetical protein EV182_005452, partial [Spiromyces aspiralis]